jgi:P27 family predicted phage terminase small subunit
MRASVRRQGVARGQSLWPATKNRLLTHVKTFAGFELFVQEAILKRGPKPKPYLVKLMEGNRGRRKLTRGIEVPATRFDPPLPLSGLALREWKRILACAPWLRETESAAIADRCLCFQRVQEAEADVRKTGFVVRQRRGDVTNPFVRVAKAYRDALNRWDAELGLTPSSRASIGPIDHRGQPGRAGAGPVRA